MEFEHDDASYQMFVDDLGVVRVVDADGNLLMSLCVYNPPFPLTQFERVDVGAHLFSELLSHPAVMRAWERSKTQLLH